MNFTDRYVSPPLELPDPEEPFRRADLEFSDVDHSGPSFAARIFLNRPEATRRTRLDDSTGFAGVFHIFGHGECFGDVGHCDVPEGPLNAYDRRPPHQLVPYRKVVTVTDALKRELERGADEFVVTVVAYVRDRYDGRRPKHDVLRFERVALVTYA
jgi:hypothetical protein